MNSLDIGVRVVKVGGSLLDFPKAPERIREWISLQRPARTIWIVGGGRLVDSIRRWDDLHGFSDEQSHWICIDLLDVTARILSTWCPGWPIVDRFEDLQNRNDSRQVIFAPSHWLNLCPNRLPASWDTTSDTIAAELGRQAGAFEIVLLKSRSPTIRNGTDNWKPGDLVDPNFVAAACGIATRVVDLRDAKFPEFNLAR